MTKEIQIIVTIEFVTSGKSNLELRATVFERVFRKLTREQSSIGKIFPVYLKVNEVHYTFGIFTLNNLGSASLFLELPEGTFFDHITFGKELIHNRTHLTYVIDNARKKVTSLKPVLLSNGTYHVLTLIIEDTNILKLAPKDILYPPVDVEQAKLLQEALFTRGGFNGSGVLEAVGTAGVVVVQIFLIPKAVDFKVLHFTKSGLGALTYKFDDSMFKHIRIHQAHLGHEFQNEYQFGLITFRYPTKIDGPLYLGFQMETSGLYFNSPDGDLNKSVISKAQDASR